VAKPEIATGHQNHHISGGVESEHASLDGAAVVINDPELSE